MIIPVIGKIIPTDTTIYNRIDMPLAIAVLFLVNNVYSTIICTLD